MSEAGRGRNQYTYPERAVPATRAESHAIGTNSKATNAVLMAGEHSHPLSLQSIPNVAGPVVVAAEEDAPGDGERDGRDAAEDVVVRERVELAIRADVEQTTQRIIGARGERVAVGEEAGISKR